MYDFRQLLKISGIICFTLALFQTAIGFFPSVSLYFGAPEALTQNMSALIAASVLIACILAFFGIYALSGAGSIKRLPMLKSALVVISTIFILRGLLLIPELLVVIGVMDSPIPVAPRFVFFSAGSFIIGILFILGTIGGWHSFSAAYKNSSR